LVELTKNTYTDSTRYAAATALLDRGYGRPAQSLDLHLSADAINGQLPNAEFCHARQKNQQVKPRTSALPKLRAGHAPGSKDATV
jgi:hypothetical protein